VRRSQLHGESVESSSMLDVQFGVLSAKTSRLSLPSANIYRFSSLDCINTIGLFGQRMGNLNISPTAVIMECTDFI